MTDQSPPPLDFFTFPRQALAEARNRLPGVSSVHRQRGWSWAGFRLQFVLWISGPLEGKIY
jgi:hypothetical protein